MNTNPLNQTHRAVAPHFQRILPRVRALTVVALLFSASLTAYGDDLPYASGSTGADGPFTFATPFSPGRYYSAMAFDPTRQLAIMYGGYSNNFSNGNTNETWGWNGATWTNLNPSNAPTPRYQHAMAYDEARSRMVLYAGLVNGGYSSNGASLS